MSAPPPRNGGKIVPALTPSLRGLFGGGMERCLEQCREELVAAAAREEGGVTSHTSFRTAATSAGGSVASGLRSVISGKLKARSRSNVANRPDYARTCSLLSKLAFFFRKQMHAKIRVHPPFF